MRCHGQERPESFRLDAQARGTELKAMDFTRVIWHKASHSTNNGGCVEVAVWRSDSGSSGNDCRDVTATRRQHGRTNPHRESGLPAYGSLVAPVQVGAGRGQPSR
jgi:hypothetical protein